MTFRDVIGQDAGAVPFHEHDASDISGEAVFTDLTVDRLLSGTINSKEIIVAGGTSGILRSDNFSLGSAGWRILGDGSAEFNDVTVRGAIIAGAGSQIGFDDVIAGTNTAALVIGGSGTLRSSNYSAGTAGWTIEGDGDAEFNDVTVRGDLISGTSPDQITIQSGVLTATDGSDSITIDPISAWSLGAQITFDAGGVNDCYLRATNFGISLLQPSTGGTNGCSTFVGETKIEFSMDDGSFGNMIDGQFRWEVGSAGAPSYTFRADDDSGLYLPSVGTIGLAIGGSQVGLIHSNGLRAATGTQSAPGFSFLGDTGTGIRRVSAGTMGFVSGGVDDTMRTTADQVLAVSGSSGTPAYAFISGTSTGVYLGGSGQFGVSAAGTNAMEIFGASWRPGSDNAISLGTGSLRFTDVYAVSGSVNTSDARVKSHLSPVRAGGLIDAIEPMQYRRVDIGDDLWHFGFVAQNVADHLPPDDFAVTRRPEGAEEWWGLRPDQLVPILWAEVRSLRARLGALEAAA